MKLTVINLPFDELAGFDPGPLEQFCDGHAVTAWVDHFFVHAGEPRLAVLVEYEERAERRRGQSAPRREPDLRKALLAASRLAFDRLRERRSLRARRDGVPV